MDEALSVLRALVAHYHPHGPPGEGLRTIYTRACHVVGKADAKIASNVCPHCKLLFPNGGTCALGGCPMGGDF